MTILFQDMLTGLDEIEAFLAGHSKGSRVTVPKQVDVKGIRKKLSMTQARFSDTFGFSLDAVKHWEGGRRTPEASARAFLTVIDRAPGAVIGALHPSMRPLAISVKQRRTAASKAVRRARKTVSKAS